MAMMHDIIRDENIANGVYAFHYDDNPYWCKHTVVWLVWVILAFLLEGKKKIRSGCVHFTLIFEVKREVFSGKNLVHQYCAEVW